MPVRKSRDGSGASFLDGIAPPRGAVPRLRSILSELHYSTLLWCHSVMVMAIDLSCALIVYFCVNVV